MQKKPKKTLYTGHFVIDILWMEVAEKITIAVQQIIEFAKMIPGFMDLSQDDQIMLLKAGKGVI